MAFPVLPGDGSRSRSKTDGFAPRQAVPAAYHLGILFARLSDRFFDATVLPIGNVPTIPFDRRLTKIEFRARAVAIEERETRRRRWQETKGLRTRLVMADTTLAEPGGVIPDHRSARASRAHAIRVLEPPHWTGRAGPR